MSKLLAAFLHYDTETLPTGAVRYCCKHCAWYNNEGEDSPHYTVDDRLIVHQEAFHA